MSLKIEDGEFYVLDLGEERYVFASEDDAIAQLKSSYKAAGIEDPEAIKLLTVNMADEGKWSISQISASKILAKLLAGEVEKFVVAAGRRGRGAGAASTASR